MRSYWLELIGSGSRGARRCEFVINPDQRLVIAALAVGMIAGALLWPPKTQSAAASAGGVARAPAFTSPGE